MINLRIAELRLEQKAWAAAHTRLMRSPLARAKWLLAEHPEMSKRTQAKPAPRRR